MKVGVTGGIGSGKSIFCTMLSKLGARIINADIEAKVLMETNPEISRRLRERFGQQTFLPDGTLNRKFLAEEAFHKGRVEELNEVVHPVLFLETDRMMDEALAAGAPMAVKEAAILLKNGRPENLDAVVLVSAPAEQRISRVHLRDHLPESSILERMQAQQSDEEMAKWADFIIVNDGGLDELNEKARNLFTHLTKNERSAV